MITIYKPGLLTTIQDIGRFGFQKYGVIASGAMDTLAHRIANLLVGNEETAPTIEMTLLGPTIQFNEPSLISICGGNLSPKIDNKPVHLWKPVFVQKGSMLTFGSGKNGCRAYLAIAGGFSVPTVMNSKSTYLRANIGGYHGRALQAGDQIIAASPTALSMKMLNRFKEMAGNHAFKEMDWSVSAELISFYHLNSPIRMMKGRQFSLFTQESQANIFHRAFSVSTESDRMGYRLQGPSLALKQPQEMLSEAVSFGTVQVPSDGNPIVLLADRQTTGGYPKIGQIASADLPLLAQAKPGDQIRFAEISLEEAQQLYLEREIKIQHLKKGIQLKF